MILGSDTWKRDSAQSILRSLVTQSLIKETVLKLHAAQWWHWGERLCMGIVEVSLDRLSK